MNQLLDKFLEEVHNLEECNEEYFSTLELNMPKFLSIKLEEE